MSSGEFNPYSSALHLVDDVFVVADVLLKVHHRLPGVMLGVDAAAGFFTVLVACHSQGIPAHKVLCDLYNMLAKTLTNPRSLITFKTPTP